MCCDISNHFVKNAQFCHFLRDPCIFFASSILSKMLNFVIFWEAIGFFSIFRFLSKKVHFVSFETRTSNYEISTKEILCIHYVLWYIKPFCQKCSILSFSERSVYFFASSILSKMLNFVIFWERKVHFFHFFSFVTNGPFCHFWNVDFKLWDNYKYTMCKVCVVIYQTFLSKMLNFVIFWETRVFFRIFNFVKNSSFCHFLRGQCTFFNFSIFVKNGPCCHFWNADFKLWDKYKRILCIHYVFWYIKLLCQKCSILSFSERAV